MCALRMVLNRSDIIDYMNSYFSWVNGVMGFITLLGVLLGYMPPAFFLLGLAGFIHWLLYNNKKLFD